MIGALLGVALAATFSSLCVTAAIRSRSALTALAPPHADLRISQGSGPEGGVSSPPPALILAELQSDRRGVVGAMELLLLRFRSAARIALAAGSGSAMFSLASELGQSLERALVSACICFALGGLAALVIARLGHAARADSRRFLDQWNLRLREATRALDARLPGAEWTDPGGAR